MLVSQILKAKGDLVFTVGPAETVGAICALLHSRRVGAMVVLDADRVVGIVSERDLVRAMAKEGAAALDKPVSAFMTHDVIFAEPDRSSNNYKQYGVAHLVRLVRIKRLTDLGFSLPQIAAMGGTQLGVAGLQVHQVIEALGQGAHAFFAADPFKRGGGHRGLCGGGRGGGFHGVGKKRLPGGVGKPWIIEIRAL